MSSPIPPSTHVKQLALQRRARSLLVACTLLACLASTQALAETPAPTHAKVYPTRPVVVVIPLGPGNSVEVVTRLVAQKLSVSMGQPDRKSTRLNSSHFGNSYAVL